tara:strand:- start:4126 stop:4704 length:579 start_codon:yes stop_codon:yes gene_type:complete
MKKLFYLLVFAILACSEEDINTSADSGIFYETHGGKLFYIDNEDGYTSSADYIPILQPEQDGEPIINTWLRRISDDFISMKCTPYVFGFNNGYDNEIDCDFENKITEQSENKLTFTIKSLESYNSEPVTQETLERRMCKLNAFITLEIKDDILTSTVGRNDLPDSATSTDLRLASDWDVSDACPGNNYTFAQ